MAAHVWVGGRERLAPGILPGGLWVTPGRGGCAGAGLRAGLGGCGLAQVEQKAGVQDQALLSLQQERDTRGSCPLLARPLTGSQGSHEGLRRSRSSPAMPLFLGQCRWKDERGRGGGGQEQEQDTQTPSRCWEQDSAPHSLPAWLLGMLPLLAWTPRDHGVQGDQGKVGSNVPFHPLVFLCQGSPWAAGTTLVLCPHQSPKAVSRKNPKAGSDPCVPGLGCRKERGRKGHFFISLIWCSAVRGLFRTHLQALCRRGRWKCPAWHSPRCQGGGGEALVVNYFSCPEMSRLEIRQHRKMVPSWPMPPSS